VPMMDRQIDSPIPTPLDFVVRKRRKRARDVPDQNVVRNHAPRRGRRMSRAAQCRRIKFRTNWTASKPALDPDAFRP
jgi:hypothetical protein